MKYLENPFTPSFGEVPAHLAGRQQIIRDLDRAFLSQRRRPELTSIFSGARGTGKTALMSSLATRAESHGWIAVKATALPGMLEEIEFGAKRAAGHLIDPSHNFEVTGLGIAPLGSIEVNSGRLRWLKKARSKSRIICCLPARWAGTSPKLGVNGFSRYSTMPSFSVLG